MALPTGINTLQLMALSLDQVLVGTLMPAWLFEIGVHYRRRL